MIDASPSDGPSLQLIPTTESDVIAGSFCRFIGGSGTNSIPSFEPGSEINESP